MQVTPCQGDVRRYVLPADHRSDLGDRVLLIIEESVLVELKADREDLVENSERAQGTQRISGLIDTDAKHVRAGPRLDDVDVDTVLRARGRGGAGPPPGAPDQGGI